MIPHGVFTPFITNLLQKTYINKSGKFCFAFNADTAIVKFQTLDCIIRDLYDVIFYYNIETSIITIVSNDIVLLANVLEFMLMLKKRINERVNFTTSIEYDSKKTNIIFHIYELIIESLECPAVSIDLRKNTINISGPINQVKIFVERFNHHYEILCKKSEKKHIQKSLSPTIEYIPEKINVQLAESDTEDEEEDEEEILSDQNHTIDASITKGSYRSTKTKTETKTVKIDDSNYSLDENQVYALVCEIYGNNHIKIRILSEDDNQYDQELTGVLSGKMMQKSKRGFFNRIEKRSIVIVSKRDFEKDKMDVIKAIPEDFAKMLIREKVIPSKTDSDTTVYEYASNVDFV